MSKAIAQNNKELDDVMVLGYLFFYTIGDIKVYGRELEELFVNNGLDEKYVRKINPVDAFRRASSAAKQTVSINYNGSQKKVKIEVDEIVCDNDQVVRAVGRKVVDDRNKKLSYETIGKMIFDRHTGGVTFEYDDWNYYHEYNYDDIFADFMKNFHDWAVFHTRDTIRNIAGYVLNDMYPVNLMPSGMCKFIPNRNKEMLYSLQNVIRSLNDYGDTCLFEVVPVVDTDEMRNTVDKAAMDEIEGEAMSFVQELSEALKTKADLSPRAVASYIEKSDELKKKILEYEGLLGSYMYYARQQVEELYQLTVSNKREVV